MSRRRDDRGATAVIVAVMAVLLFSVAAVAVDLGNAWARKRDVQKQVDISALSAGYLLPQTNANKTAIAAEVATYLNQNRAAGQPVVSASELIDSVMGNGEVEFLDGSGDPCVTGCTEMRVTAPPAHVDFGLAGVMGFSGTSVQRSATVLVESALPPKAKTIPLWLPSGCGLGSAESDTSGGGGPTTAPATSTAPAPSSPTTSSSSPTGSSSPSPSPTASTSTAPAGEQGDHTLSGTSPYAVASGSTTDVMGYVVSGVPANTDRASMRFYSPDGTRFVEYAVTESRPKGTLIVPSFAVGPEVTDTPGDWSVYAMVQPSGADKSPEFSDNHLVFRVTGSALPTPSPTTSTSTAPVPTDSASASPSSVPVNCVGQARGNFGQLDSPRKTGGTKSVRLALNMAVGLDHQLVPFVFAPSVPVQKTCEGSSGPIPGAKFDDVATDGRNCIVGDPGNDGPRLYDGLVSGPSASVPGRLAASRGNTYCPADPSRSNTTIGGVSINNDVLSCFLRNGATLAQLTQPTGVTPAMLDPAIVDSPRFVWIPVVYANDRAQKDFQPILDFVPAFITDETQTSSATSANGLEINGSSVKTLTTFVFNKAALPIDEQSHTVGYDATMQQSVVRLTG